MDLSDLSKLRVVDLKQELQNRGLDTKGVKAVLIERLREAMSVDDGSESNDVEGSSDGGGLDEAILPDEESSDARGVTTHSPSPEPAAAPPIDEAILLEESESTDIVMQEVPDDDSPDATEEVPEDVEQLPVAPQEEITEEADEAEDLAPQREKEEEEEEEKEEVVTQRVEEDSPEAVEKVEEAPEEEVQQKLDADDSAVDDAYTQNETMPMDEVERKAKEAEEEAKKAAAAAADGESNEKKRRRSNSPENNESSSRRRPRHDSQTAHADDFMNIEDEPALPEDPSLSWVDSDLHVKISGADFCEARTLSDGVLGLMWAGARATHGVTTGKTFYEVQLQQKNARINYPDEKNLFDLRCGWSTLKTDLYLGQSENSFAYAGEGKKILAGTEEDFGVKFGVGDVIGVYLDMAAEPCQIQFTVNGEDQGVAFEFEREKLNGEALFPHVLTKNFTFKVNFGQLDNTLLSDYTPRKRHQERDEKPKEDTAKKPSDDAEEKKTDEEVKKDEEGGEETVEPKEEEAPPQEGGEEKPQDEAAKAEAAAEQPQEGGAEENPTEEEKKDDEEKMEVDAEEEPEKPINRETLPDFTFISRVPREELTEGLRRVETRKECEVIMLIGLPGAGKTHWVTKWNEEHPEKRYNIIGNNYLYDRMNRCKLSKSEKFNDMCNRSFTVLQELAQKRRRNYIFDQTNVYASAQRRKMKGFGDFKRIAVIVIPDDEEYKRRVTSKNEGGSKELADYAVNEMKANFSLPTLDLAWFDEIKYVDLEEEAATKLVQDYNERGRRALPQSKRRPYEDNRDRRRRDYGNDRRWDRGDRRDRWDMGGYRGPSGWRPPPPRDYYGGYDRRDRWNEPSWVSGGNRRYERDYRRDYASRDYPRRSDNRDNRSGRSGRDQDFRERRSDNRGGGGDNYASRSSHTSARSSRRDYTTSSRDSGSSTKNYGNPAYGGIPAGGAAMATQGGAAWGGWQQQQQWPMAGNWGTAQGWNQGGWSAGGAQNWGGWDQWSAQAPNGAEWNTASWDVNQAAYTTNSCPNVDPTTGQTN